MLIAYKIDILAINETKLDPSVSNNEINIPGFEVVRKDRNRNGRYGGGVCIYIRNNLNFNMVKDLCDDRLEMITIEITLPHSRSFLISTWYRPPNSPIEIFQGFEEIIDKIDQSNLEYYLLGDMNCDMLSDSHPSVCLNNILDLYGLKQLITEPTRITQNTKTLIDLCITNTPEKVTCSGVRHVSISDHSLVFMCRKSRYNRQNSRIIEIRSFKKFNESKFLEDLSQMPWEKINTENDVNKMWQQWREMFMSCVNAHAPIRHKRIGKQKPSWLTSEIRQQLRNRDYLKKKAMSSDSNSAWSQYKKARNQTNNALKRAKREYFTQNLAKCKKDQRKTWNLLNELTSRKANKTTIVNELKYNDKTIASSNEIANTFNEYFTEIGATLARSIPATSIRPESYLEPTNKRFSLESPTIDIVLNLLQNLNERKAIGLDKIPNRLLKMAANVIAPSLTMIFSQSIAYSTFPEEWKLAKVTPIYKKGGKKDPSNYRPISVIPAISKIFEKIVYDQLYNYLDKYEILTVNQSGFRNLHSTMTALIEATNKWSLDLDQGRFNGIVFIDLQKAFDTIDHAILITKLKFYGIDSKSLGWFSSYLSHRSQQCSINGALSSPCEVSHGIPQGSNLGPLLFLIYINDLPNCLSVATPRMFADDTSISVASESTSELESTLNLELEKIHDWLTANRLSLNVTKTEVMVMASRQKLTAHGDLSINVHINNQNIKQVENAKTLGVTIDKNLNWSAHIQELVKKVSSAISILKRSRPYITKQTAIQVYDALILPHLDYCSEVWDGLGVTLIDRLQKLQNRAARTITSSNYDIRSKDILENLNWKTLDIRRKKQKAILMFKIMSGLAPAYLQEMFTENKTSYKLRNSEQSLTLPKPKTEYMKRSFAYTGAKLWNAIPLHIKKSTSIATFKKAINDLYSPDSHGKHGKQ